MITAEDARSFALFKNQIDDDFKQTEINIHLKNISDAIEYYARKGNFGITYQIDLKSAEPLAEFLITYGFEVDLNHVNTLNIPHSICIKW